MFFIGIFGIQDKARIVKEFANVICRCGKYSRLQVVEYYRYFHFFFIPVFKWNRRYIVEARCCGRLFEVPKDYVDELLGSDFIDLNRLKEINSQYRVCLKCGKYADSSYSFCPYCGSKL